MAEALILFVFALWIVRKVWPRANPGARLATIGGVIFAFWALIAVTHLSAALRLTGWLATGIIVLTHGAGTLIMDLS